MQVGKTCLFTMTCLYTMRYSAHCSYNENSYRHMESLVNNTVVHMTIYYSPSLKVWRSVRDVGGIAIWWTTIPRWVCTSSLCADCNILLSRVGRRLSVLCIGIVFLDNRVWNWNRCRDRRRCRDRLLYLWAEIWTISSLTDVINMTTDDSSITQLDLVRQCTGWLKNLTW